MAHTTFALSAPSACSATATNGYKGEARAYREKLSKAKPRDIKGVVCRGLPWVCFGQRFYLSDLDELRSQLSCHSTLSLTQVECSQHQDSATARPTDLESTVVWASARGGRNAKLSTTKPPDAGGILFLSVT